MADRVRFGIIGSGMMGVEHMMNLGLIEGAEVVALADPNEPSLDFTLAVAKDRGIEAPETFPSGEEMLAGAKLDAVIVATPNHTHAEALEPVWETGLPVLCEKPLCTTLDDAKRVRDRAAEHKGIFWVGMEYRYMPPVTRFVETVHSGFAGDIKMLSIREHRYPFLKKVGDWNRFNRNSGGTLVEKSCHYFDMMRHVLRSEPLRVFASGGQDVNHLDEVYDGEVPDILDNAFVVVDFANGARAMHDLCMFAEASRNQEEMAATGTKGKVECLIPEGVVVKGTREPKEITSEEVPVPQEILNAGFHHGATYYQLTDFLAAVRGEGDVKVRAEDGLKAVALGIAAQRSIEERRPVEMSEFDL